MGACDHSGNCLHDAGNCTVDGDCATSHCSEDFYCCSTTCGMCQRCPTGTCVNVPVGKPGPGCSGNAGCDGSGFSTSGNQHDRISRRDDVLAALRSAARNRKGPRPSGSESKPPLNRCARRSSGAEHEFSAEGIVPLGLVPIGVAVARREQKRRRSVAEPHRVRKAARLGAATRDVRAFVDEALVVGRARLPACASIDGEAQPGGPDPARLGDTVRRGPRGNGRAGGGPRLSTSSL